MSEVAEGSNAAAFDVRPGDVLRLCTAVLPVKPPVDTMSYYVRARASASLNACACVRAALRGVWGVEVWKFSCIRLRASEVRALTCSRRTDALTLRAYVCTRVCAHACV